MGWSTPAEASLDAKGSPAVQRAKRNIRDRRDVLIHHLLILLAALLLFIIALLCCPKAQL